MLIFRTGTPWMLMFRSAGSAVKESCFESLFAALLTLILEWTVPASYMTRLMVQPYPLLLFQYIAAITLVFRTKIAYGRYWECATTSYEMGSKLGDAFTEGVTFDELINTNKRQYGEDGAVWLEKRRRFQALLLRRLSLMHALALQYLRRDDCLKNLVASDGREPNVPMGAGAFGGMEQPTSRADPKWQQLEVLGGITESELASLENTPDRVGYIFAQIMHISAQRRCDGGLGSDAPVLSRFWQTLSDGHLGMRQSRKIEDIPFPWPYTQAVSVMTRLFTLTTPLYLAHFANCSSVGGKCDQPNWWVAPLLAFMTVSAYVTIDAVAHALEDPYVHPPNDLPANAIQAAFNNRLLTVFDSVRRPADGAVPVNMADDPKYWDHWAELEADDVRLATLDLLREWRAHGTKDHTGQKSPSFRSKGMVATPDLVGLSSGYKPTKLKISITDRGIFKQVREVRMPSSPSRERRHQRLDDAAIEVV
jgi:predicted membrane chloride channel (bestrophin family)